MQNPGEPPADEAATQTDSLARSRLKGKEKVGEPSEPVALSQGTPSPRSVVNEPNNAPQDAKVAREPLNAVAQKIPVPPESVPVPSSIGGGAELRHPDPGSEDPAVDLNTHGRQSGDERDHSPNNQGNLRGPAFDEAATVSQSIDGAGGPSVQHFVLLCVREREREMETQTGRLVVEKVGGKSTVTSCFSKYPLKFIIPNKVGSSENDAVWVYTLTYGGGIVSGDSISCEFSIGDGCTTVLTTQASTKVYKSLGSKCSEQILEARIGSDAILAVIPDPVTCFSTARYSQKQIFRVVSDSSLVIVDWITSGRHESGTARTRKQYQHFRTYAGLPSHCNGHTIGVDTFIMPKLKQIQNQIQENVKRMMSEQLYIPSYGLGHRGKTSSDCYLTKPTFIASCSVFGPKGIGVVVRIAAMTTESVYRFLHQQLASLEPLLGVSPYC
ncbi:hypothetical protein LWI29_001030 [Acer saccharum]|uniref:Urease accessory protein D n=1 Tax=Acer saccharum TaxID=4024 RepID=A0AA39VFB3_ACESA|nr:hypothetical protein LWI29_001030 [Acer saccharum]